MPHPDDCLNQDRFLKLEKANADTATELHKIGITLTRIETTLTGKVLVYDKHVDDGEKWRTSVMAWIITTLVLSIGATAATAVSLGIWLGKLQNQVEVNTKKWEMLEIHKQ